MLKPQEAAVCGFVLVTSGDNIALIRLAAR